MDYQYPIPTPGAWRPSRPLLLAAAVVIVTAAVAASFHRMDLAMLARLDTQPAEACVAYERHLHSHSYTYHLAAISVFGGLYVAAIEGVAAALQTLVLRLTRN